MKSNNSNPPIVLLTDFGTSDGYAGTLHGVLKIHTPKTPVIDLSHHVPAFDIVHGSYILKSSYPYFPRGSIFLCVVDPGVGTKRKILCVKTADYFFIGPDNGLLAPVTAVQSNPLIREIQIGTPSKISSTFHGRDIMAPAAAKLAENPKSFSTLGPVVSSIVPLPIKPPRVTPQKIQGSVYLTDAFGNMITTIERRLWPESRWKKSSVRVGKIKIPSIQNAYASKKDSKPIALFNSGGYLEIAWPQASAKKPLGSKNSIVVEMNS